MKKKKIMMILVVGFILMLIPIPLRLKDGGSIEYHSLLYSITKIYRMNDESPTGYEDGWKIEVLGIEIYNKIDVYSEIKKNNYELIFEYKTCLNCYKKIYESEDGTRIYSSCDVKYKTEKVEISLYDALNSKLLTLSDLENVEGLLIVKPNEDKPFNCIG